MRAEILNKLTSPFPYRELLMNNQLEAEKRIEGINLPQSGFIDKNNENVLSWFDNYLKNEFHQFLMKHRGKEPSNDLLQVTGPRSFNASYTGCPLQCAIVSENSQDFHDFCVFLNDYYGKIHEFSAIKTKAGLPILTIKGKDGFQCDELKTGIPQLEVTFRDLKTHQLIQSTGNNFFLSLSKEEKNNYILNKSYIAGIINSENSEKILYQGKPVKEIFEEMRRSLDQELKTIPSGSLKNTMEFNDDILTETINSFKEKKPESITQNKAATFSTDIKPGNDDSDGNELKTNFDMG